MIALGVRYLTKYAVATDLARQRAEWPPHPGRVFMAMAAAHFETGGDPGERAALEWLEASPAPALRASEAEERTLVRAYVPVNDAHGGIVRRARQDRAFPRVRPREDTVFLIWDETPEPAVREALQSVCRKVTRIGHSSSAVQMWVATEQETPAAQWVPTAEGSDTRMRVPSRGTMQLLVDAFNGEGIEAYDRLEQEMAGVKGRAKAILKIAIEERFGGQRPEYRRPVLSAWQGYRKAAARDDAPILDGPFDPNFIVLEKKEGRALGLEATLGLSGALRNAAMHAAGENPPEWLTGHDEQGAPSRRPHVAFFPLAYVGAKFADGHVLGMGIAIPKQLPGNREAEIRRTLGPLFFDADGEELSVKLWSTPGKWDWELARLARPNPPYSLVREAWMRPSRRWASVTPVVLHHHPKKNREGAIERIVREAFVSAGFPQPQALRTGPVSFVQGAGHCMSMPPFDEGGAGMCRYQTHVEVLFASRVRGPVLVGRGRFRGYGLFRPVHEGEGA